MLPFFFVSIALSCPEDENDFDVISLPSGISQQEICDQSTNIYELFLSAGEILHVEVLFSHVQGDLDVYLYEMNGLEQMKFNNILDNESYLELENISYGWKLYITHHIFVCESSISSDRPTDEMELVDSWALGIAKMKEFQQTKKISGYSIGYE